MMYYILKDNEIKLYDTDRERMANSIRLNVYHDYQDCEILETDKMIYTIDDKNYFEDDPEYIAKHEEEETQRIAQLHLTRGDVFRGLLLARQVTRAQIRALIEQMPEETPEQAIAKEYALIDFDESLDFYRGVALIETLGLQLGISSEAMTRFFETNDWHYLIPDTREVE